jgi:UDP-N-acetyl-2-amino-2-deoxyglucuronate dehydrogenase
MARFALIGVAGFVARRHLDAIQKVGGRLVAALDPHDSVGLLDRYSLGTQFFTDEGAFAEHLLTLARAGQGADYVVVCSPNFLHAEHIALGLRLGADVICEKPLVTTGTDLERLAGLERETERRVHPVLQLRHHPALLALARELPANAGLFDVQLDYVTPRGPWYDKSWKGDPERSGGLLPNIGVHFLDALLWLFGAPTGNAGVVGTTRTVSGQFSLERARITFRLSIDAAELPTAGARSLRRLTVSGREVHLDGDLDGLHDRVYEAILGGRGLELADAKPALELCFALDKRAQSHVEIEPCAKDTP